ncbi:hypothetical protein OH77DRAFT_1512962 [Trametes cingulata]|nr:hypothetical protein OH77DRAFT_1512962 [Trametes cingulata]
MTFIPTPAQTAMALNASANANANGSANGRVAEIASALAEFSGQSAQAQPRRSYAETVATIPRTPPRNENAGRTIPPPLQAPRAVVPARGGPIQAFTLRRVSPTAEARRNGASTPRLTASFALRGPPPPTAFNFGDPLPVAGRTVDLPGMSEQPSSLPTGPLTPPTPPARPSPTSSDDLWKQMENGPFHSHIPSPVSNSGVDTAAATAGDVGDEPEKNENNGGSVFVQRGHKRARTDSTSPSPPERSNAAQSVPLPSIGEVIPDEILNRCLDRHEMTPRTHPLAALRLPKMGWHRPSAGADPVGTPSEIPRPKSSIHSLLNPQTSASRDATVPAAITPEDSHSHLSRYGTKHKQAECGDPEAMEWTPQSPLLAPNPSTRKPAPAREATNAAAIRQPTAPPLLASFSLPPPPNAHYRNALQSFDAAFPPIPEEGEIAPTSASWLPTPNEPYPGASFGLRTSATRRTSHSSLALEKGTAPSLPHASYHAEAQPEAAASLPKRHSSLEPPSRWTASTTVRAAGGVRAPSPQPVTGIVFTPPPSGGFQLPALEDPEALLRGLSAQRARALYGAGQYAAVLARVYNVVRPDPVHARQIVEAIEIAVKIATGEPEPQVVPPENDRMAPRDHARYPGTWVIRNIAQESVSVMLERGVWSYDDVTFFAYPIDAPIPRFLFSLDGFDVIKPGDQALFDAVWDAIARGDIRDKTLRIARASDRLRGLDDASILSHLLASFVVNVEDLGNGRQVAAVYCDPPTDSVPLWRDWKRALESRAFTTTWNGTAVVRRLQHCKACHGADHPTHICPYQLIPGWRAPPPGEAHSFAAIASAPPPLPALNPRNRRPPPPRQDYGYDGRGDDFGRLDDRRAGGGRRDVRAGKSKANSEYR